MPQNRAKFQRINRQGVRAKTQRRRPTQSVPTKATRTGSTEHNHRNSPRSAALSCGAVLPHQPLTTRPKCERDERERERIRDGERSSARAHKSQAGWWKLRDATRFKVAEQCSRSLPRPHLVSSLRSQAVPVPFVILWSFSFVFIMFNIDARHVSSSPHEDGMGMTALFGYNLKNSLKSRTSPPKTNLT